MKNILIRLFLLSFCTIATTGFLFDCDEDSDYEDSSAHINAVVYPEIVTIGDTVYCNIIAAKNAYGFGWRIDEKPVGSETIIQYVDDEDAFFIPDAIGVYKITLVYSTDYKNFLNHGPFTVEVAYLRAYAGYDIGVDVGSNVALDGSGSFGNQLNYLWTVLIAPQNANIQIINPTSVFATYLVDIPGDYFIQLKVTDVNQISDYDTLKITATEGPTGDIWTQLTNYPGTGNTSFVAVGDNLFGYVGLGSFNLNQTSNDFWKFTPAGNGGLGSWMSLSPFPSDDTQDCLAFIIDGKIYVGLGSTTNPLPTSRKFFTYDISTDTWDDGQVVAEFPGEPRTGATAFVLDGYGYVGLGYKNSFPSQLFSDLYKFNPLTNTWQQLQDFPDGARFNAVSFVLENTAYIGYGVQNFSTGYIDFWSYDQASDDWTSITPIQPVDPRDVYYHSIGVTTSTNGYLIGGGLQAEDNGLQVWEFGSSSWIRKTNSIESLIYAFGFVINDKVYCGGGGNRKWYRYDPSLDQSGNSYVTKNQKNKWE